MHKSSAYFFFICVSFCCYLIYGLTIGHNHAIRFGVNALKRRTQIPLMLVYIKIGVYLYMKKKFHTVRHLKSQSHVFAYNTNVFCLFQPLVYIQTFEDSPQNNHWHIETKTLPYSIVVFGFLEMPFLHR